MFWLLPCRVFNFLRHDLQKCRCEVCVDYRHKVSRPPWVMLITKFEWATFNLILVYQRDLSLYSILPTQACPWHATIPLISLFRVFSNYGHTVTAAAYSPLFVLGICWTTGCKESNTKLAALGLIMTVQMLHSKPALSVVSGGRGGGRRTTGEQK